LHPCSSNRPLPSHKDEVIGVATASAIPHKELCLLD
jgi:hypothetical protein